MENRLPLPSHLARHPLLAGEDILLPKRASKQVSATLRKQELPSFLAAKSCGWRAASQVDEDYYYWGTFPMGFPPSFAFSLPNTSRKLDFGGCFCSRSPLQPPQGTWAAWTL